MTRFAKLLAHLSLAVVSGCVARVSTNTVGKLPPEAFADSSTGVVVFSAGAPEARPQYYTMLLVFDHATRQMVPHLRIYMDSREEASDVPEYHSTVHALRLPPGSYDVIPGTVNYRERTTPTFRLEVRAGETTYAGELFLTWNGEREKRFAVRDWYNRDLAVARAKNPALGARPVVKRLMRAGPTFRG